MLSLEAKLAAIVEAMNPAERKRFADKSKNMRGNVEATLTIAESILGADVAESRRTENIRESGQRITRNNGGSRQSTDADRKADMMEAADAELFTCMEACRSTAKGIANLVEVNGNYVDKTSGADQLSESERQDLEFCRQIGLTESESLKVVKSKGGLRG